jgi:amidase
VLYRSLVCVALLASVSLVAYAKKKEPSSYAVEEVPLTQISADLASGRATSVAVTEAYIERIKAYDGALHAVIRIASDASEQAAASDKRRARKKPLGPLDGVPILLKDNIDAVGMPTTAGSYALAENLPAQDSEVAKRLHAAGAVILGKANTMQWAGLRTVGYFSGSTIGGNPHNPYDLTRTPSGSSSGPGIAAAVSFAAATVGTDTTGSIISPASANGVVGLRPTIALISRRGIVPVSLTQDTAGPMARTVTDTALLLSVLAGSDPGDPQSKDADAHKTDYTKGLNRDGLKGKRLGVLRGFRGYSEKTKPIFDAALQVLAAQDAELVEIPLEIFEDLSQEQRLIMLYDFKDDLGAYLARTPPAVTTRTLADLIEFDKTEPHEKLHGQDLFEAAQATANGRRNPEYIKTLEYARRKAGPEGFDRAMSQYNVSALVVVSNGPATPIVPDGTRLGYVAEERPKGAVPPSPSGIAALAGYPDLSVPMGFVEGLPVGLSFIGPAWSEQMLLSYAYAYEQGSHSRMAPKAFKSAPSAK